MLIPLYDNEDSVCGICFNGEYFYFQKNLQGDIISVTDKDANEVAKYTYDAWGVCTITSDTSSCSIATINPYRYRGYYYDTEIGMYYLQSRYYNPTTSRFLNGDMAEVLGLAPLINDPTIFNLYVYCSNNPVTDSDSVGRLSEKQLANMFSITFVFEMFFALMLVDQPAALVKVGTYVMKIATPIATKAFWWKPWLIAAIVLAAVAIVVAGVLVLYNIKQKELKKSATRVLKNVKERITNSKVFKLAYVWGTELVKVGASMSFVTALTVLGVKKAACSLARRYSINPQRPTSCKGSKWGVYSTSQAYAAALAIMLGCTSSPEVHNPGEYGHYHDKNHHIHIWYGYPINYHI